MKNLKKILALALVFAFSLTLFAGAAFTDEAEIGDIYKDDVSMLVELGILGGYPDGSFKPEGNITRAEFCKMVYSLMYGADSDGSLFATQTSKFTDVEGNADVNWAKGYINYCANQNIVGGLGDGTFNPSGNITVAEVSKMLLVLLGCDPVKEGFGGPNWAGNVVSKAMALGVFNGWVGNSADVAERQLVAKLMRNTIFAPVYRYNAFTGMGSQYNMDQEKNETLGESVMDMSHVTGIVVANESFAIVTDEEGEFIVDESGYPDTPREDTSYVRYLTEEDKPAYLRIDKALDDTMLGSLVDVYFRAQGTEGSYSQVEVIGNVLVNGDTRAYDVYSQDIEIYPNGKSSTSNKNEVAPYITFTVDGIERTIKSPDRSVRAPMNERYDGGAYFGMSYACNDRFNDKDTTKLYNLKEDPSKALDFFDKMGEASAAKYRIVSVDGGNSYSYIFKFHNHEEAFRIGLVTNYNEARNTITVSGYGTEDLEDVILHGDISQDSDVIMYRLNGKLNLEKLEVVTGSVEDITGDTTVLINGVEYGVDFNIFDPGDADNISEYYSKNKGASNEGTRYYVYKNIIVDIDADATVADVGNYAVVLNSTYDAGLDTAYVKLAFADDTEGTYEVTRFYTESRDTSDEANDYAQLFAHNGKFGWIYRYNITSDGKVNLGLDRGAKPTEDDGGTFRVKGDTFVGVPGNVPNSTLAKTYYASDDTVIFFLYGHLEYEKKVLDDGSEDGRIVYEPLVDNKPIKAKAYKLKDLEEVEVLADAVALDIHMPDPTVPISNEGRLQAFGNAIEDTQGSLQRLVVGMMTYGDEAPDVIAPTDSAGYVARIEKIYNVATNDEYIRAKIITEDGLLELSSIDSYDDSSNSISNAISDIDAGKYDGTIVRFKLNSDGKITSINNDNGTVEDMKEYDREATSGVFYATIVSKSGDLVAFFPYFKPGDGEEEGIGKKLVDGRLPPADEAKALHKEFAGIITIRNYEEYAGEYLTTHSSRQEILEESYNAIIQVVDGKILRIFSFED